MAKLFGWEITRNKTENTLTRRDAPNVPAKVFIQEEGNYSEYSEMQPHQLLMNKFYDLMHGEYAASNFIELFYALPEVFAPIHEIASRVADANWQLLKTWNDEVDYKDAQFNRLFTTPNPLMNHKQLVYISVVYEILTGKCLWNFYRSPVLPDEYQFFISWWNLPSNRIRIETKKDFDVYTATELNDIISAYKLPLNNKTKVFETDQVLPIMNFDIRDANNVNKCISLLQGASKAIKNLIPVYEARGVIYIKRGALGFIVSRKKDADGSVALTKSEKNAVNEDVNQRFGLGANQQTISVVAHDIDFVKTSMTIEELQPFDETLADAAAIYAVLRVPPHLIPSKDKSTYANANSDMKSFYQDVIIPWAKKYAQAWDAKFKFDRRYIFPSYSHIQVLQDDKKIEADTQKVVADCAIMLYEKGAITKNERNVMIGSATVADGNVYIGDNKNPDPLGISLGVGGIQSLIAIISDPALDAAAKQNCLTILFGITPEDAKKMIPNDTAKPTKEDTGTKA